MGHKCDLNFITFELAKDKSTLEISKIIWKYQQTVKTFVAAPTKVRKRANKGHSRVVFKHYLSGIKCEIMNKLDLTSSELLVCIGKTSVFRTT